MQAVRQSWGGYGIFELYFRPDGTAEKVSIPLSTDHAVLDDAARKALLKWRCAPGSIQVATLTISFETIPRSDIPTMGETRWKNPLANIIYMPYPVYPIEARRYRQAGQGIFVLRFRPSGTVAKVVALKATGVPLLDLSCVRSFIRWRCRPGALTTIKVPVTFTIGRRACALTERFRMSMGTQNVSWIPSPLNFLVADIHFAALRRQLSL